MTDSQGIVLSELQRRLDKDAPPALGDEGFHIQHTGNPAETYHIYPYEVRCLMMESRQVQRTMDHTHGVREQQLSNDALSKSLLSATMRSGPLNGNSANGENERILSEDANIEPDCDDEGHIRTRDAAEKPAWYCQCACFKSTPCIHVHTLNQTEHLRYTGTMLESHEETPARDRRPNGGGTV
jgi:hypothetical protein